MAVRITRSGPVVIATVTGTLDHIVAQEIEAGAEVRTSQGLRLVVDLAKAGPIASSGVAGLIGLHDALADRRGRLALAAPDGDVRTILELTNLDELLTIAYTLEDAVRAAEGA